MTIEQRINSVMSDMGRGKMNPKDFGKFYQRTVESSHKPAKYTANIERRIKSIMVAIDNQVD